MLYLKLFLIFFEIGLFTIGGGLAALPLLQRELVISRAWITQAEFIDMIAVSQSTPGPIGINMATFIGFRLASFGGALIATAGMVAPSLIIILLIARFLKDYAHLSAVEWALSGLRPAALGLIAAATWFILGNSILSFEHFPAAGWLNWKALLLMLALSVAYHFKKASPILYICLGGIGGIVLF